MNLEKFADEKDQNLDSAPILRVSVGFECVEGFEEAQQVTQSNPEEQYQLKKYD